MKYLLLFLPIFIYAKSYMGIIKPINSYTIYAQTSGEVVEISKSDETKVVSKIILKLDKEVEINTLKLYERQLSLYRQKLKINQDNYKKFITIKGKSKVDRDDKLLEIIDLKNSIAQIKISITELKNSIKNKTISIKNLYIKEFLVNKYDYVISGTKIATVYDISKSKVAVYVNSSDYKDIKEKIIYINDKKSNLNIYKLDITPDETYISSFKTQIILELKDFGSSVKVEFKDE